MLMIEDRLFKQDWFQELPVNKRLLYIYLLVTASKSGVLEIDMKNINSNMNRCDEDGIPIRDKNFVRYTREDILNSFGNRIQLIPGHINTAIIVDYIKFNWMREKKDIDIDRNPLFKSITKELAKYDMTIDSVLEMAEKAKAERNGGNYDGSNGLHSEQHDRSGCSENSSGADGKSNATDAVRTRDKGDADEELEQFFKDFWVNYPGPRKVNKRVVHDKFIRILKNNKGGVCEMYNHIMAGLDKWKKCDQWVRDNGQYIPMPERWLNAEYWKAEVPNGSKSGSKQLAGSFQGNKETGIF